MLTEINLKIKLQKVIGLINWFSPYVKKISSKLKNECDKLEKREFETLKNEDIHTLNIIIDEIIKKLYYTLQK